VKTKPRVAYLLQMFGVGGMPKWLFNLATVLRDEFDFYFIATHSNYIVEDYRKVARVAVLPFNKWVLSAYLWINRIDIAQVANLRLYVDAALAANVPVIIERVDGIRSGAALGKKEGVDAVIASTRGIVPHLEKLIAPEKIHTIYNGVLVDHYSASPPQRFGFAEDDVIIGRTSRLAGGKNISLLIRAVIELRKNKSYQHVRLVICGGDNTQPSSVPMLEQLKHEALPLGENVVFTGEVFDTASITAGFDIATCTSQPNNEGIPNSLIEAMAAGKPIVASQVDDIPELVKDNETGLLFPPNDLGALVAALRVLIDNKNLRLKMGALAQEKISRDFDISVRAREYATLYWQLLKKKSEA
jgi:glycosyltransferase involved in cell wall biosynthesis